MPKNTFPRILVSGDAEERGFQHGQQLSEEVNRTVEYYARIFDKPSEEILAKGSFFQKKIHAFEPDYCIEIEALAHGAKLNPLWIYALNARSEILSMGAMECTSLYFQDSSLLGQNWDWTSTLEELLVLMEIEKTDGHKILMITEPGMLGKIGLNSSGLGVCLNILKLNKKLDGVPVHILLRAILDSKSVEEARDKAIISGLGKASNILVADAQGNSFDIEFAGDECFYVDPDPVLVHTNHFLARPLNKKSGDFLSSYARFHTASEKLKTLPPLSLETMKEILLDQSNAELPICQSYHRHAILEDVGTVCTIVMDLKERQIHLKKGNISENDFYEVHC
ncbi:MAG: peptidase C45 [SAR324 cluster bacterium]|nr:peptidase C45 [SAR324 cluster bacterium]